ncbi:MAG: hypothetical protein F6J97_02790 [Leptolyngbya sp. SIO4C1]|nr:hypothetical protein [Leptolyngbya sp. SIO4C1]
MYQDMDYWEFLIQQEGDQTWLPLETKQVEILEGRYRVAAHTNRVNTPVEVRLDQILLDELPPRRRVRKRRAQTNEAGLLIIFPFMQLAPGKWDISCSGADVMNDLLGAGWQHRVQLQVLPRAEEEWEPDWSQPEQHQDLSDSAVQPEQADGSVSSSAVRSQPALQLEQSLDQAAVAAIAAGYHYIQLKQQAYLAQADQPVMLAGDVLSPETSDSTTEAELWVQLRDPQTTSILLETRQPLSLTAQRASFSLELLLPNTVETRVVVGETALFDRADTTAALASATFTITLGLLQILERLANAASSQTARLTEAMFEEEVSVYPGSTEPFTQPVKNPETLISPDLPLSSPKVKVLVPSLGITLPPQIYRPEADKASEQSPELPSFPPRSAPLAEPDLPAAADPDSPGPLEDALLPAPDTAPTEATLPELDIATETAESADLVTDSGALKLPAIFDSDLEDGDLEASLVASILEDDDNLEEDLEVVDGYESSDSDRSPEISELAADLAYSPPNHSALDEAFQSLNLQERFWDRLTSLTYEGHRQAAELRDAMQAAGVSETATPATSPDDDDSATAGPVESVIEPLAPPDMPLATSEVVVYEEIAAIAPPLEPPAQSPVSDQQSFLPAPVLEVPARELTAGEMISVGIRIDPSDYRPYIKVWMNDLQTRTLIEEPRLLMHLVPNANGELETFMRLKVPQGCLELQIAAIAVDMSTLQESRKAVANRRVIPANLSSADWNEFEL